MGQLKEIELENNLTAIEKSSLCDRLKNQLVYYRRSNAWESLFRFEENLINGLFFGIRNNNSDFVIISF